MVKRYTSFTLILILFLLAGCSNKKIYNQGKGVYLDSSTLDSTEIRNDNFRNFRANEMSEFRIFANGIYTDIEETKKETEKYTMKNRQIRDSILYTGQKENR